MTTDATTKTADRRPLDETDLYSMDPDALAEEVHEAIAYDASEILLALGYVRTLDDGSMVDMFPKDPPDRPSPVERQVKASLLFAQTGLYDGAVPDAELVRDLARGGGCPDADWMGDYWGLAVRILKDACRARAKLLITKIVGQPTPPLEFTELAALGGFEAAQEAKAAGRFAHCQGSKIDGVTATKWLIERGIPRIDGDAS